MPVSMPMSFFDQLAIAGRCVAAETTKRTVLAAQVFVKEAPKYVSQAHHWANQAGKVIVAEAPKHISTAQSLAVAAAKIVGAQGPKGIVATRRIGGKAARVVVTGAPKGAVAVTRFAGRLASKVVAETPRQVAAARDYAVRIAKVVAADAPKRYQATQQFATRATKAIISESPKHVATAKNKLVGAAKKAHTEQYGKTLAGGTFTAVQRVSRVAVKTSITVLTVSIGLLVVAGSKILSIRLPAASSAGDTAAVEGSAVDLQTGNEMATTDASSAVPPDTAADRYRQAVVQGVDQIVQGAAMAVGGLLGMAGRSLSQKPKAKVEKNHDE